MRTETENRDAIALLFKDERGQLGDEKWNRLVDEISAVSYEYLQKQEALPKRPGVLDANAAELKQLNHEEDLKWVIIKLKYGV